MKGKDIIGWIEENHLEEAEVYIAEDRDYALVKHIWESEKDGGSVILETKVDECSPL